MSITSAKQFGEAIRRRRKALSVTQSDVAMAAGTGVRFIVDLENGKPTGQIGKAFDVLRALGLTLDLTPRGSDAQGDKVP